MIPTLLFWFKLFSHQWFWFDFQITIIRTIWNLDLNKNSDHSQHCRPYTAVFSTSFDDIIKRTLLLLLLLLLKEGYIHTIRFIDLCVCWSSFQPHRASAGSYRQGTICQWTSCSRPPDCRRYVGTSSRSNCALSDSRTLQNDSTLSPYILTTVSCYFYSNNIIVL